MGHCQRMESIFDRAKRMPHWLIVYEKSCGEQFVGAYPYFEKPYLERRWEHGFGGHLSRPLYILKVIPA